MQRRNIISVGDKFGKLTVLSVLDKKIHNNISFLCKCDCGNTKECNKTSLLNRSNKSCGCYSRALTKPGDIFGLLTVIELDQSNMKTRYKWICECQCGNRISVAGNALQSGNTKSCGCTNSREYKNKKYFNTRHGIVTITGRYKDTRFYTYLCDCGKNGKITETGIKTIEHCGCLNPKPKLIINPESIDNLTVGVYNRIIRGAFHRNITFNITQKELWDLYIKQDKKCALSGESIYISPKRLKNTASLDRIDSSKGYTIDNVQWVHREINMIKGKWKQEMFLSWVYKINDHTRNKDISNAA